MVLSTGVLSTTNVVKLDCGDERSQHHKVTPTLLSRIDEVLQSGKFKSARQWCREAHVSDNYINVLKSRMSTGEVKQANMEPVRKLAHAAGVSVDWLMGEKSKKYVVTGPASFCLSEAGGLDQALEAFPWPDDLEPALAAEVIRHAQQDAKEANVPMPQSYWHVRLRRLVAEVQQTQGRRARRKTE